MKRFIVAMLGSVLAVLTTSAQTTNVPLTKIETMEARPLSILIKGFSPIGSVTVNDVNISIVAKETSEASTGHKLKGVAVEIVGKQQSERIVVDGDELDSLLSGLDYMSKADYNISQLPGFDATYTTRGGLRTGAFTSKRSETIQAYLRGNTTGRLYLTAEQLGQFRSLVQQAKTTLDSLDQK